MSYTTPSRPSAISSFSRDSNQFINNGTFGLGRVAGIATIAGEERIEAVEEEEDAAAYAGIETTDAGPPGANIEGVALALDDLNSDSMTIILDSLYNDSDDSGGIRLPISVSYSTFDEPLISGWSGDSAKSTDDVEYSYREGIGLNNRYGVSSATSIDSVMSANFQALVNLIETINIRNQIIFKKVVYKHLKLINTSQFRTAAAQSTESTTSPLSGEQTANTRSTSGTGGY